MGNEYEYGDQNASSIEENNIAEVKTWVKKRNFNLKSLKIIIIIFLLLLFGYWVLPSDKEEFPKLAVGSYLGEIKGVDEESTLSFFIESLPSNEFFINIEDESSEPQRISLVFTDGAEVVQPVTININGEEWKLIGSGDEQNFSGKLIELEGKREGTWKLKMLPFNKNDFALNEQEVSEWAKLTNQYETLKQEVSSIKTQVTNQTKEIEKLTDFIVDADRLKARSEKKYRNISQKLDEKNIELKQVESEAQVLENRLALAQKVTDMGRLVLLARQTLERENRWINSALGGEVPYQGEDFQRELENAKKILSVKRAIQEEEEYIAHLRSLMAGNRNNRYDNNRYNRQNTNTQRPSSFGSLWGDR